MHNYRRTVAVYTRSPWYSWTLQQRGLDLHGSTYIQIFSIHIQSDFCIPGLHICRFNKLRLENSILNSLLNVEGRLHALFHAIVYKGLEHPRIVSERVLEPILHGYRETTREPTVICGFLTAWAGWGWGVSSTPKPALFKGQLYFLYMTVGVV